MQVTWSSLNVQNFLTRVSDAVSKYEQFLKKVNLEVSLIMILGCGSLHTYVGARLVPLSHLDIF